MNTWRNSAQKVGEENLNKVFIDEKFNVLDAMVFSTQEKMELAP